MIEAGSHYMPSIRHMAVIRDKHFLHPGRQFEFLFDSFLPQALIMQADIFNSHNYNIGYCLNESKMFEYRTHPFTFLFNIAYEDKSQMDIIIENGHYNIYSFKSHVG